MQCLGFYLNLETDRQHLAEVLVFNLFNELMIIAYNTFIIYLRRRLKRIKVTTETTLTTMDPPEPINMFVSPIYKSNHVIEPFMQTDRPIIQYGICFFLSKSLAWYCCIKVGLIILHTLFNSLFSPSIISNIIICRHVFKLLLF